MERIISEKPDLLGCNRRTADKEGRQTGYTVLGTCRIH